MVTPWLPWKNGMIAHCAAESRSIWQPRQENDRYQRHAPEVTSNCHPGRTHEEDEAEETSESESTEPGVRGEKEEDQN
jgi:hypothetical protein